MAKSCADDVKVDASEKEVKRENSSRKSRIIAAIIDKGVGGHTHKQKILQTHVTQNITDDSKVHILHVPEPATQFTEGMRSLKQQMDTLTPNVLIAGSRGGRYIAELLQDTAFKDKMYGTWHCCIFMLSALHTSSCVASKYPMLLYHARFDASNRIENVRSECKLFANAKLIEAKSDTHSLESLRENDQLFIDLVMQAIQWFDDFRSNSDKFLSNSQQDNAARKALTTRLTMLNAIHKFKKTT